MLDAAVGMAQRGEPQFVVFGGEAGVGKTRLMEQFTARLGEAGWCVMRGTCVQLGTEGLPLAAIASALRDLACHLGAERIARLLPGSEVALRLLPEVDMPGSGNGAVRGVRPEAQRELFEVFAALLQRLSSEHAVLVVLDDLHLADRSTRDLLGFLVRSLRAARVVVVGAYRSDDLGRGHPLRSFLAEIERLPAAHRVELGCFARAETAELIADVLGERPSATLVDTIFRRSGGNAFFAEELARADPGQVGRHLPESLRVLLLDRVGRLDEAARAVVRMAAVGDPSISHSLLAETAGFSEDALLAGLHAAVDARVLTADSDRDAYRFQHALLREAVLEELFPAEQLRLHRACAEALEARPDLVTPDRHAAEIAFHWYNANEPDRALPALLRAAAAAEAMHAHAEHSQMLLRALDVWTRVPEFAAPPGQKRSDLWEKLSTAALLAGETRDAFEHVDKGLQETDRAANPEGAALLHALRSLAQYQLGRDGVDADVEEALRLLPNAPSARRAKVLDLLGHVLMFRRQPGRAREASEEAAAIAARLGDYDMATSARTVVAAALAQQGACDEALRVLADVRDRSQDCGDAVRLAHVHDTLAHVLASIGHYDEAIDAARAGLDLVDRAGVSRTSGATLSLNLADALVARGRWDEADATCVRELALDPLDIFGAHMHAIRGQIALTRGDLGAAREQHALAIVLLGQTTGMVLERLPVVRLGAEIAISENRLGQARDAIRLVLPVVDGCNDLSISWRLLVTGARVETFARMRERALGDTPSDGTAFADALRTMAATLPTDTPVLAAYAAQFNAEIGAPGARWSAVIGAWDEIRAPYAEAYARLRAAETAGRTADGAPLESWLRTAAERADWLGAKPLLEEIELAARSAGVTLVAESARTATASDLERLGLTEREVEVLRLVAAGSSNRQIAEQLVISPKTASVHVSRILGKLNVARRGEAAAVAHRLRLFDQDLAR